MKRAFFDHKDIDAVRQFFEKRAFIPIPHSPETQTREGLRSWVHRTFSNGAVIFAHGDIRNWITVARENENIIVVLMSTAPEQFRRRDDDPSNLGYCRYPITSLTPAAESNIDRFLSQLESKTTDWTLLSPRAVPQSLVAAYILMLGKREGKLTSRDQLGKMIQNTQFWNAVNLLVDPITLRLPEDWETFLSSADGDMCGPIEHVKRRLKSNVTQQ